MSEAAINNQLGEMRENEDNIEKKLNNIEKNSNNQTQPQQVKTHTFSKLVFGAVIYLIILNFMLKYIGAYNVSIITNSIFNIASFLSPDLMLFSVISANQFILFFTATLIAFIYFDFYFLLPWTYLVEGGHDLTKFTLKLWSIQKTILGLLILTFLISYSLTIWLFPQSGDVSPIDIAQGNVEKVKDSYWACILKNFGDPALCKAEQDTKQADISSKNIYKIKLLDLPIITYNYQTRNNVSFTYEFQTKGTKIKIDKFECYHTRKKSFYLINKQEFDNLEIIEETDREQKSFHCDLSQLNNPKPNDQFKIIPVIYYTVENEITQEMPLVSVDERQTQGDYYLVKERYKTEFNQLNAISSSPIIDTSTLWEPMPPIFTNPKEIKNNKDYKITFTLRKASSVTSSNFGDIVKTEMTKLSIPEIFEYNCGDYNQNCQGSLLTEKLDDGSKSHLELYLTLKSDIENVQYSQEYLIIKLKSQLELTNTETIKLENPEYKTDEEIEEEEEQVDNLDNNIDTNQEQQITQVDWEEYNTYFKQKREEVEKLQDENYELNDECNNILKLINEGFVKVVKGENLQKEVLEATNKDTITSLNNQIENKKTEIEDLKNNIENKITELKVKALELQEES